MSDLDKLKQIIDDLFHNNPNIHINVSINRPKIHLENQEARIINVYPNIFVIESGENQYTIKYLDLFTNAVEIHEVGEEPFLNNKTKIYKQGGIHRHK